MAIHIGKDHINDIQMHLWCTKLLFSQERRAIRPPPRSCGPRTAETGRSNENLFTAPGKSESLARCPTYLGCPAIALVTRVIPHHGCCRGRLRRKSEQVCTDWCEYIILTGVNKNIWAHNGSQARSNHHL